MTSKLQQKNLTAAPRPTNFEKKKIPEIYELRGLIQQMKTEWQDTNAQSHTNPQDYSGYPLKA